MKKSYKITIEIELNGNPFCLDTLNCLNNVVCSLYSKNEQVVQIHKTIQLINEHGENFEIEKINIDQGKNFIIKTNVVAEVETTFKNINIIKQIECEAILPKQKNNNYFNIVETKIVSVENFEKD